MKVLNSENLAHLALTLFHAKVIKGQDTKKEHPLVISFHLIKNLHILFAVLEKCFDIFGL